LTGTSGKNRNPLALAAWGFQPKPYHNASKELPAYNGTKIIKNSLTPSIIPHF
jgi:hypothetical protein